MPRLRTSPQRHQRTLLQRPQAIRRTRRRTTMQTIGWVKIHRKIIEWGWFYDGNMLKTLLWLICNANTVDSEYRGMPIRRGSLVTSRHELSRSLSGKRPCEKISEQQVRTILNRLQRSGEILVKSTSQMSIVTVCKYDKYQFDTSIFDDEATNDQPTVNQPSTINQPHNKNKRIKEYNNNLSLTREETLISEETCQNIKRRYNDTFGDTLPTCQRLSLGVKTDIRRCIEQFGSQSVDTAFQNLSLSPWLTGNAPSGWMPDIKWLFQPDNYQRVLSGYYSPRKPTNANTHQPIVIETETPQQVKQRQQERFDNERQRWLDIISIVENAPDSHAKESLITAYQHGTLQRYGINWQPPTPPPQSVDDDLARLEQINTLSSQEQPPTQGQPHVVSAQNIEYVRQILKRKK